MYSFGNKLNIGEMSMQPIGGDELGAGFGDDVDINDATYDVDDVSDQMALAIDTDPYAIGQNLGLMGDGSDDGSMSEADDSTDPDAYLDDGGDSGDGGLGGYTGGLVDPAAPSEPWTLGLVPGPAPLPASPSGVANVQRLAGLHLGIAPAPSFWQRLRNLHLGLRAPAAPVPSAAPQGIQRLGHLQLGMKPVPAKHLPGQPHAMSQHPAQHPAPRTIAFNIPKGAFGP